MNTKLKPAAAKSQALRAQANFKKLPEFCYCYHPVTKHPIRIYRGTDGYAPPLYPEVWVEEINGNIGVTVEQEEAMLAGSMFGWHIPLADPDTYKSAKYQAKFKREGRK